MKLAFPAPPLPRLAVADSDLAVPLRRVYCVGRNYAEHAREMGADPDREPPFFFSKPADAVVPGGDVPYPPATADLHHEVELAVVIGTGGADLDPRDALAHVYGYAVAVDLTRRDLQAEAKRRARPWDMAKGFDASCPCSAVAAAEGIGHPGRGAITLEVNGERRQTGDLAMQIWSVPETLAHLSRLVHLAPGDLVLTGTPAGVGPLVRGDRVHGRIDGVGDLHFHVA